MKTGSFLGRGIGATWTTTKAGDRQVTVQFELTDEAHSDVAGETIFWNGSFKDKARDYTYESLAICGIEMDELPSLANIGKNEVRLVIIREEYNGEEQFKVRYVNDPHRTFELKNAMSADKLSSEEAAIKAEAAAYKQKRLAKAAMTNGTKPATTNVTDPPF